MVQLNSELFFWLLCISLMTEKNTYIIGYLINIYSISHLRDAILIKRYD